MSEFKSHQVEWESIVGYMFSIEGKMVDGDAEYGNALRTYSAALGKSTTKTEEVLYEFEDFLASYNSKVKYQFGTKYIAYYNLGLCWHQLGPLYDTKAINSFKSYLLNILTLKYCTSFRAVCYSFRSCSTFLYQSLINDTLNLSSPTKFNDPFDCPIFSLLDNSDDVARLIRSAYLDCVKVACFVNNIKLPFIDEDGVHKTNVEKHEGDIEEYLNPLMWAHYADSHKGICIKYRFPNELTQLGAVNDSQCICFLKDVSYSDTSSIVQAKSISLDDAFFAKGRCWEYENEMRLLYYNPNDKNPYVALPAHNTIEAIYFGLECSSKDRETIINILKGRKCIWYNEKWDDKRKDIKKVYHRKNIQFFQIIKDAKHFGQLSVKKIVLK